MDNALSYVRRARLFETYAKYIWPVHRLFVKKHLTRRCKICIISENCEPLTNGICGECLKQTPHQKTLSPSNQISESLKEEFEELLASYQQRGKKDFDALLLLSGGKDSSFLLHQVRTNFPKLRVLALTVDSGFLSPVAKFNVEHVVKKLNVDHVMYKPQASVFEKLMRYALTHVGERGTYEIVDRLDGTLVHDIGRNFAAINQIPLLLSAVSWVQVNRILGLNTYQISLEQALQKTDLSEIINLPEIFTRHELQNWWNPSRFDHSEIPLTMMPFFIWRFDEQEIRRQVIELGLIKKGNDSPLVTNNLTVMLMGLIDVVKIGYSSFEPEFASLVREGKTEAGLWRNIFELLDYCGKTGFLIRKEIDKTIKQLNLTRRELGLDYTSITESSVIPSAKVKEEFSSDLGQSEDYEEISNYLGNKKEQDSERQELEFRN